MDKKESDWQVRYLYEEKAVRLGKKISQNGAFDTCAGKKL